jgi:5,6-dimethylbenzimidazole synthase
MEHARETSVAARRDGPPEFDAEFRAQLYDLLRWRRDVRRFKRDPLPEGAVERLISIACLSPSVGLSEPWRFVVVEDASARAAIRANFQSCNADALQMQTPDRAALYARLKLAGLDDAPCQLAMFSDRSTAQGAGLGRLTMPETLDYSVVNAVHTLWLAARAEGIGLGWVSILDPARIAAILGVPADWVFIGHLCLGYPLAADDTPALERAGWEHRHPSTGVVLYR